MTYPIGAKILVDGHRPAIIMEAYPEGSTSYLFAHYVLRFVGSTERTIIAMSRVGIS